MTFKQAIELGGCVRKGEKSTHIVFTKQLTVKEEDEERKMNMLRGYSVFNVAQIDGLPEKIAAPELVAEIPDDNVDRFIQATGADIRHGGSRACFVPSLDIIQLPPRSSFVDDNNYHATTLHELGHDADVRIMPRRM